MTSKLIAAAALGSLLSLATIGSVQAAEFPQTLKPLHAVSFQAGDDHAVAYFSQEAGRCKLVITSAGEPDWSDNGAFTATRFEAEIPADQSTHFRANDGKTMKFKCQEGAQAMVVESAGFRLAAASR